MQEFIDRYFEEARDILQMSEDKLELCLLFTHCFEDHYEADSHSQRHSHAQYATRVFTYGIEDTFSEGNITQLHYCSYFLWFCRFNTLLIAYRWPVHDEAGRNRLCTLLFVCGF